MRTSKILISLAFCMAAITTVVVNSEPAYACLVEPCPSWPSRVSVNFGNTLVYEPDEGICTVVSRDGREIQRSTSCRRTWHQIVYTSNMLLFYDRSAGEIEIYNINERGIANRLQRFTNAQNRVRKTWASITSSPNGVVTFTDDNGQVENYRLTSSGSLQRL